MTKPYVESGRQAAQRLAPRHDGAKRHCLERLRGFKQVINVMCLVAILAVPIAGVATQNPRYAVAVGLVFLLLIWMLEIGERAAKRELKRLRQDGPRE
jgi:Flp pilus assembly protein TadB